MKYIVLCMALLVICFEIGYMLARYLTEKSQKPKKLFRKIVLTVLLGALIMSSATFGYMSVYYHAGEEALYAMENSGTVTVQKVDGGYFFDGRGDGTALIFYPGAKVESEAYAKLMIKLAENDIDCFLADMPLNFAMFGGNAADKFINAYDYDTWIIAGHSMGGTVASSYAAKHTDKIDGLVLLASYPTDKVSDDIKLLSIYGSEDRCLDKDAYDENKTNWSEGALEFVIDGGNHSQFADYGLQKGDGMAIIAPGNQQTITAQVIKNFFK